MTIPSGRVFVVTFVYRGDDGEPWLPLRHMLKTAWRRFNLRCTDIAEIKPSGKYCVIAQTDEYMK